MTKPVKTIKILESTHKNLNNFKKRVNAKSLGEAIDSLFAGYDRPELNITLESSHFFQVNKANNENIKVSARLNMPITSLRHLRHKINGINLLQRAMVNLNGYCSLADHAKLKTVAEKVENGLITSDELVRRIRDELIKVEQLAENLDLIDSKPNRKDVYESRKW